MIIEHVAIWTDNLEGLKEYYQKYFGGKPNDKYTNAKKGFQSYFLSFDSGARLELMSMPSIPNNANDTVEKQHNSLIHFAFGVETMDEVAQKAIALKDAGFPILRGPRKTGDGY